MHGKRIEMLQRMPIFGALREDTLEFLLGLTREVAVPALGWFCREGDRAQSLFVIESGQASVLKGWQGQERVLRTLGPGDCVGEMALMDLMPRSAGVRADTDCVALELGAAELMALFEHDLEQFALLQMNLGREVSRRLRVADERLFAALQHSAEHAAPAAPPGLASPPS
jgi:CRP-like cAMP-binding protein